MLWLLMTLSAVTAQTTLRMEQSSMTLQDGYLTSIIDLKTNTEYVPSGQKAPLMQVKIAGKLYQPTSVKWEKPVLTLTYQDVKVTATVNISEKGKYCVFELTGLAPKATVDAVVWGPYPTTIGETVGEFVGVVRNDAFAIGIQALNTKTTGGELFNDEGSTRGRGTAAVKQAYGSSVQAFSLDRSRPRVIDVWADGGNAVFPRMPVPPIPDETPVGSKIALFACREAEALQTIGIIEPAEGLPHPLVDGEWIKTSEAMRIPYMISEFSEDNFDFLLSYVKKGGFAGLYHGEPFSRWGHFELDPKLFPNGRAGLKACVEKAKAAGLRTGLHTLTTFLTPNDEYITPVPNRHLAVSGKSILQSDLDEPATEIIVADPQPFIKKSDMNTVWIGDELIRYDSVSASAPYKLLNCSRAMHGTKAANHKKGSEVKKLVDHGYHVFFPDFELQKQVARNMSDLFNETGVNQMDFDGHEGAYACGQGDYGRDQFAYEVFTQTKHLLINGSSGSKHFYWHLNSYLNWGEPWYGGFRESQSDYRIDNQPLLERNFMPNMLGWFLLTSSTTIDDVDWMMTRSAAWHAGFAFVARERNIRENPEADAVFDQIKLWLDVSHGKLFTPEQRQQLKDTNRDFHLAKENEKYYLYPWNKHEYQHICKILQPGEPTSSEYRFENRDDTQPFRMIILISGEKDGIVRECSFELDNHKRVVITGEYKAGTTLVVEGTVVKEYNDRGRKINEKQLNDIPETVSKGSHCLIVDGKTDDDNMKLRVTVKTKGAKEVVGL